MIAKGETDMRRQSWDDGYESIDIKIWLGLGNDANKEGIKVLR